MTIEEILAGLEDIATLGAKKYGEDHKNVRLIREARELILTLRRDRINVYWEVKAFMDVLEALAEWKK